MRVFCVLVPGGGGPPARRPRCELPACRPRRELPARRPWSLCSLACLRVGAWGRRPARSPSAPRASLGASYRSPCRELPACRPPRCELPVRCVARCLRGLCSLACLRVGAWGRRPARSPSAPRASLGASSRSPARPCRRPQAPEPSLLGPSVSSIRAAPCFRLLPMGSCSLTGAMLPPRRMASRFVPAWGGSCVGENPQLSRVRRPATASSLGATRRGLCLPSQLRFPLAFGR